jgi:hypothetical protein
MSNVQNNSYEMLRAGTPGSGRGADPTGYISEASHYDEDDNDHSYDTALNTPRAPSSVPASGEHEHDPMMTSLHSPTSPTHVVSRGSGAGTPLTGGRGSTYLEEYAQRRFFGPGTAADDGNGIGIRDSLRLSSEASTPMNDYRGSFAGATGAAGAVVSQPSEIGSGSGSAPLMGGGNDTDLDSAAPFKFGDKEASSSFNDGAAPKERKRDRILNSYAGGGSNEKKRRRMILLGAALVGLIILAVAIAVPVALTTNKKTSNRSTSGNGGGGGGGATGGSGNPGDGSPPANAPTTGGNGSTVTTDKNTTFTYYNPFGGFWVEDLNDPFNMNAQAQSYVLFLSFSVSHSKKTYFKLWAQMGSTIE